MGGRKARRYMTVASLHIRSGSHSPHDRTATAINSVLESIDLGLTFQWFRTFECDIDQLHNPI